mmetsp:Transcript_95273/g.188814  ORF Transcript_95273/g.188814 Transcript_95273/m.188814 type:complete len:273 (-) Transcript_95273:26-844(-)
MRVAPTRWRKGFVVVAAWAATLVPCVQFHVRSACIACRPVWELRIPKLDRRTIAIGRFGELGANSGDEFDVHLRLSTDQGGRRRLLQLLFARQKRSIGFVPIELGDRVLLLRGISMKGYVEKPLFVAIWLELCFLLGLAPRTARIDKPLVALALQRFGFACLSSKGHPIEVLAPATEDGTVILWSENRLWLQSFFSKRCLKHQNMLIAQECPAKTQTAYLGTDLAPVDLDATREAAAAELGGRFHICGECSSLQLLEDLRGGNWPSWATWKS